jgi:hypothetical protein
MHLCQKKRMTQLWGAVQRSGTSPGTLLPHILSSLSSHHLNILYNSAIVSADRISDQIYNMVLIVFLHS